MAVPGEGLREGTVVRLGGDHCYVLSAGRTRRCRMRGRLRGARGTREAAVVVGDRVRFDDAGGGEGVVEEVLPRRTKLSRRTSRKGERIFAANIDQVLAVASVAQPKLRPSLIDRVLIAAEREGLEPAICLNKVDLDRGGAARSTIAAYRDLGYRVVETSATEGAGLDALRALLRGRASIFAGHSGVGKTSLLNAMLPGLDRRVRGVSRATEKGRHATADIALVPLPEGGFVVDTPGFRAFTIEGIPLEEIGRYYPEFRPHIARCRFPDCLHMREPGCAVRAALERGEIPALRFRSYLNILRAHRAPDLSPGERFRREAESEQGIEPGSV